MSGYASYAPHYLAAGFSPLPLPHGLKTPPPEHWTGYEAPMATAEHVAAWSAADPEANIGLRLPDNVVGIDYDAYKADGVATMNTLTAELGPLPATWRSSSREDGSGIFFFLLPDDLPRIGDVGPGIETIRHGHRYAVVAPSRHPDGGVYRWFAPDGGFKAPKVDDLPSLPVAWVEHLIARGERKMDARSALPSTPSAAYESLEPGEKARIDAYVNRTLEGIRGDLAESAEWAVGQSDSLGRGWEKLQADKAIRLAGLALADWNDYTLEQARADFHDWAPTGDGWGEVDVEQKFVAQARRASPALFPVAQGGLPTGPTMAPDGVTPIAPPALVKRTFDDKGFAERAYVEHRGRLLYLTDTGSWARWDGARWRVDPEAGQRAVQRTVEAVPDAERGLYTDLSPAVYGKLTSKCRQDSTTVTATNYLRKTGGLDGLLTAFDAEPHLLQVANGVVDLRDGKLYAPNPALLMLRGSDVLYDPSATAPEFSAWLEYAQPDPAMREYLQTIFGASLTAESIKRYWVHEGVADAGKSMLAKIMMRVLGDAATAISDNLVTGRDGVSTDDYARATLRGSRLAILDEVKAAGHTLDVSIKRLIGGAAIVGRNPTERPFTFVPHFKLHITANSAPTNAPDSGIVSRLEVLRWDVASTPRMRSEATSRLGTDLGTYIERRELSGVLAWAVRGAARFYADGLRTPVAITQSTDAHLHSSDLVGQWLEENTIEADSGIGFSSTQGWTDFKFWQERRGERVYSSQRAWAIRFKEIVQSDPTMVVVRSATGTLYRGRALRTQLAMPSSGV